MSSVLPIITTSLANVTGNIYIGQKVHFNADHAVSLTGFTTPAFDVKRKTPGFVTSGPRFLSLCKNIANMREQAGIGGPGLSAGVRPIGL